MNMLASFWVRRPSRRIYKVTSREYVVMDFCAYLLDYFDFVEEIYLPVLRSTQTLEILNLILRIMCEAWLDHIYTQKIPFR